MDHISFSLFLLFNPKTIKLYVTRLTYSPSFPLFDFEHVGRSDHKHGSVFKQHVSGKDSSLWKIEALFV